MKKNKYFYTALLGAGLLMSASCSSDDFTPENGNEQSGTESEYVSLTLNVTAEDAAMLSREINEGTEISQGDRLSKLIYAVYQKTGNGYILKKYDFSDNDSLKNIYQSIYNTSTGQFTIQANKSDYAGDGKSIIIDSLLRGNTYKVAFWAQGETNAFTTTDLTKVSVNYTDAKNNDELRDAFCATSKDMKIGTTDYSDRITLRRPFAQINVGTTGADYRNVIVNESMFPKHTLYTHSSIKLKGVANTINVVTEWISGKEDVNFAMAPLASYINADNNSIPSDASSLINGIEKEVWLKVDLNGDGEYKKYKTTYPTLKYDDQDNPEQDRYLTETFKYMSMCYVLVPITSSSTLNGNSTLDEVTVIFGTSPQSEGLSSIVLYNVPVQRNWRTNILGGLRYMKDPNGKPDPQDPENPDDPNDPSTDPTDPKDPDYPYPPTTPTPPGGEEPDPNDPDPDIPVGPDPGSLFNMVNVWVNLSPIYENDYNGFGQGTTVNGTTETLEWTPKTTK